MQMLMVVQYAVRRHTRGDFMSRNTHHVVHNPNGGWEVKRSNSTRASGHYQTKEEAIHAGQIISQNQKTEFIIHGLNGKIQRRDSHGNAPFPPKG